MGGMKITNDCSTCYSIVKTFVYWCSFVTTFYFICSFALIGSFVVFRTCTCSFVTFVLDNTGASIMFSTTAFS
jgi:hypothetical protein